MVAWKVFVNWCCQQSYNHTKMSSSFAKLSLLPHCLVKGTLLKFRSGKSRILCNGIEIPQNYTIQNFAECADYHGTNFQSINIASYANVG
jgi:hypothetical protein